MRRRRILTVLLLCAGVVGVSLCLCVYVVFYPVAFADSLFEPTPIVRSATHWGPWRPISELGSPGAVAVQEGYTMYRTGRYRSLVHDIDVCEVRGPEHLRQKFVPGYTCSRVSVLRLTLWCVCIVVIGTVVSLVVKGLKRRYCSPC